MKTTVKMDEKGRFRLPNRLRRLLKLRPKQMLSIEVEGSSVILKGLGKVDESDDAMLHDMVVEPGKSKVPVTRELLERMKEEMWLGA